MARNDTKSKISPTEQKLLDILSDGHPHSIASLKQCLSDEELSSVNSLQFHISNMRKILLPQGRDIVARDGGYRLMRTLYDEG